jgi:hypothetical protein
MGCSIISYEKSGALVCYENGQVYPASCATMKVYVIETVRWAYMLLDSIKQAFSCAVSFKDWSKPWRTNVAKSIAQISEILKFPKTVSAVLHPPLAFVLITYDTLYLLM